MIFIYFGAYISVNKKQKVFSQHDQNVLSYQQDPKSGTPFFGDSIPPKTRNITPTSNKRFSATADCFASQLFSDEKSLWDRAPPNAKMANTIEILAEKKGQLEFGAFFSSVNGNSNSAQREYCQKPCQDSFYGNCHTLRADRLLVPPPDFEKLL